MSPVIPKINKNPIITIPTYWIIIWTLGGISFLVIQLISENRIKLPSSNGIGSKFINPSDIEIKEIKEREEYKPILKSSLKLSVKVSPRIDVILAGPDTTFETFTPLKRILMLFIVSKVYLTVSFAPWYIAGNNEYFFDSYMSYCSVSGKTPKIPFPSSLLIKVVTV